MNIYTYCYKNLYIYTYTAKPTLSMSDELKQLERILIEVMPSDLATIVSEYMQNIITVVVDYDNVTTFNNVEDFKLYVRRFQHDRRYRNIIEYTDDEYSSDNDDFSPLDIKDEITIIFCGMFVLTDPKNLFRDIAQPIEGKHIDRDFNLIVHGTLKLIGDCHAMFKNSGLWNIEDDYIDLSGVDVSKVTNMSNMFEDCNHIGHCILSGWDVSSVTNMSNMFCDCEYFKGDLSRWDVSQVTNMKGMFAWCEEFKSDLSEWDVSQVTNMADIVSCL